MQTVERPRFRQDLVAEPIEDGGARFIDVADPDTGNLFRFYEVEYSLACAMDGERDVPGIVKWAQEELGLTASAKEVRTVIATLGDLGYLDSGVAASAAVNAAAAAAQEDAIEASTVVEPAARPAAAARTATPAPAAPARTPAPARMRTPPAGTPAARAPEPMAAKGPADLELGASGGRASAQRDEMPRGGDLELGAPGAAAGRSAASRGPADDFALGASGARSGSGSGFSTDLAADMAISVGDVKEAVRASQVLKAVDIPPELAAELESPKPAPAKPAAAKPAPEAPVARPVEPRAEATPPPKPIEMPTERPVLAKAPPAPRTGPSPILLVLLVLVLLGAGGFALYKFVLKKDSSATQQKTEATEPKAPVAPPPPPVETAKLAVEQPAPEEIKPTAAATIATIVASDTAVKTGDTVAQLAGYKPLETETAALQKQVDKAKADVDKTTKDRDAAQTAGNKNGVTAAETKLAALQKGLAATDATLATKQAALDKFLIKSPGDGKITAVAKANAKVTPTDIVATLTREPLMVTTFKSAGEVAQDSHVLLAIKGSEQKLSCTVVASGADGTKIACPKDAAPEGTEVSYAGVDPNAPTPAETKPSESAAGSGATEAPAAPGSAAPAGSAS